MALRTYLPTLRVVARAVCNYIGDHREKIIQFVGEENADKVDAANTACVILVGLLDSIIPNPI